jgi:hypothetical protein
VLQKVASMDIEFEKLYFQGQKECEITKQFLMERLSVENQYLMGMNGLFERFRNVQIVNLDS